MNRISASIIVLFLLIILLNTPTWLQNNAPTPDLNGEETLLPNYRAKKMLSSLYSEQGELVHEVYAETMEHYDQLGFTLFQSPEYTIYTEKAEKPWQVNADEGTLYEDNRIQLETNVEIKSLDDKGFVQTIKTSFIEINLDNKTMKSDQAVTILGKDYIINSNGFTANLVTRQFELLDHVQTIYGKNMGN